MMFKLLILAILAIYVTNCQDDHHPLGCGGFVRSSYKLDYDKIEIKLFTKQGSLKMRTECAPTTGYYFIPLDGEGEYILKISPPDGWTFEPAQYELKVDGASDQCSKGIDVNFDFKGFSVQGNVMTEGLSSTGPSGVELELLDTQNSELKLQTKSTEGGSFEFSSIPPGKYLLKASHKSLTFGKNSYVVEVKNKNVKVENQLTVTGFQITGKVKSDKNPVQGVQLVLLGSSSSVPVPSNCETGKLEGSSFSSTTNSNSPSHILCHKVSDVNGIFQFSNVRPGKYAIVPVYKGKNIVYNVSPDRLEFEVKHDSVDLDKSFEVEGFTVQGRVKDIVGANILVNGEFKVKSGTNGEFTIPKMRPGTYDFEVTAENVQFDKEKITITPNTPVLPDFIPSRYLTCGRILLNQASVKPDLTLIFIDVATLKSDKKTIHTEKVPDPNHVCVLLKRGKYQVTLSSKPYKSFTPEKFQLDVPSETPFAFQEFTGFISGTVNCDLIGKSHDMSVSVLLKNQAGELVKEQSSKCGESYKFSNLESGQFRIQIVQKLLCWEKDVLDISLETANIENANFKQAGFSLHITSTHDTKIEIFSENEKNQRKKVEELELKRSTLKAVCLKSFFKSSFSIEPKSCHKFENDVYTFTIGNENELNLIAIYHTYSGQIRANSKMTDLQVKKNDQMISSNNIVAREEKSEFIYDVSFLEAPGSNIELTFFSYSFILEPNVIQLHTVDDCQQDVFHVTGKKSHVIQGKLVPPLEDVQIRVELIGEPDSTVFVTSNEDGSYIAGPFIHNRGFKVVPSKSGYAFKPMEKDPYSFNVFEWAKIQVKIFDNSNSEIGIPNALLSLSGPNAYRLNKVTDSNGEMLFGDLQPGQYYLKPLLREFSFEPNAVTIDLKEQESKVVTLKASRESFSLYGSLSSLSGDLMPDLIVTAKGQNNCSEYAEDGVSDEFGNFRIWSLKSYCTYRVSVVMKDEFTHLVERTIPEVMEVKIGNSDTHDVSFIIITPVKRMDVSLRVHTNLPKYLDSLRAIIYTARNPNLPIHSVSFNGVSYIILPPIPKDDKDYIIIFESSLSKDHYEYSLPPQINFTADRAYEHYSIDFNVQIVQIDQEIGKSSYFAFAFIILVFLIITYFDKLSLFVKDYVERFMQSSNSSLSKKVKVKKEIRPISKARIKNYF